jgi:nitroreductase/dihydropteridine reductase
MSLVDSLNWRYACKKFDPKKKVSAENIDFLKETIRLSPSSYGLQLYKVLIIEDNELRSILRPASWNQSQITDCSHLFVFCHYTGITKKMVEEYAQLRSEVQGKSMDDTMKYIDYMYSRVGSFTSQFFDHWSSKQTYIALSNLLTACGERQIDACPIEGFEKSSYNEILGLPAQNLASSVVAAVGYRAEDEANQYNAKVRRPSKQIFEHIR